MNTPEQNPKARLLLNELIELLDISPSYYKKVVSRYKSMATHFHRPDSLIRKLDPAVYPQGSFRLGTVIRPLRPDEGYDLDIVCRIKGSTALQSQRQVKELVGVEVKSYSQAQDFKVPPEEGKRCWTQQYQDEVDFHMDVLPSIPNDESIIRSLVASGIDHGIAREAVSITDRTDPYYESKGAK